MTNEKCGYNRRKSFQFYNPNKMRFLFPCLFIYHQINLLNIHKRNCLFYFSSSNLLLVVCYNHSTKGVWVFIKYSILVIWRYYFIIYRVYFCFILDLRRTKNKLPVHILNIIHDFYNKQHFYKQRLAEIGKKWSKC